jgi:glycosyltransferase involved in cell wall biosynthesis
MAGLTVLRHGSGRKEMTPAGLVVTVDWLHSALRSGELLRHLLRYSDARIRTHRLDTIGRPLKLALLLRLLSHGRCVVEDEAGHNRSLSLPLIAKWAWQSIQEPFTKSRMLENIEREVAALTARASGRRVSIIDGSLPPLYLRTDLSFGLKAGGSVGHTAGVVNHLGDFGPKPIMLTTDLVPTVAQDIEVHTVRPAEAFWEYPELPTLVMNGRFAEDIERALRGRPIGFLYQRYSLNNFSGAKLSAERGIPFVLEYNGSEIWMSRHWGTPLEYEALSTQIELANFALADVIVVVSQPMADELIARGVPAAKILVNPNGVEPDVYSPSVDGGAVRRRHGLEGKTVIGFIGTFGPWHGAEVLARAFVELLRQSPSYRESLRLLMIGDGVKMPEVVHVLTDGSAMEQAVLAGIVPQSDGPAYLAACDVLASPHVPNPDGTPFFGSPTKLFEYMAMGKGIVASDLDQVGDILEHGRAAQMVIPGDVPSLVDGLRALIENPARREQLAGEARRMAVERHSWQEHTRRIIDALRARVTNG